MAQMKQNSSRFVAGAVAALVALFGFAGCSSSSDTPAATKTTYTGTLYIASEGGAHVAVVPVTIDPSNTSNPITVAPVNATTGLRKIQLKMRDGTTDATGPSHTFHDIRLDGTKLYYSSIFPDSSGGADAGKVHLGWIDLSQASTPVHDSVTDPDPGYGMMVYCGSGQTATHFIPMTMSNSPYIDAIPKSALTAGNADLVVATDYKRTMVSSLRGGDTNFQFAHGNNHPNGHRLYVAVNETSGGVPTGTFTGYLVNMDPIIAGTADDTAVAATDSVTGLSTSASIPFRSTFTPNGDRILQAGADRLVVLDGNSLAELDNNTAIGGTMAWAQAHDVMPTPDGKYAILSLRFKYPTGLGHVDSGIQLYDLTAKKTIGNVVSTCNRCHRDGGDPTTDNKERQSCGIDGKLTTVTQ